MCRNNVEIITQPFILTQWLQQLLLLPEQLLPIECGLPLTLQLCWVQLWRNLWNQCEAEIIRFWTQISSPFNPPIHRPTGRPETKFLFLFLFIILKKKNCVPTHQKKVSTPKPNFTCIKVYVAFCYFVELGGSVDDALVWRCDWRSWWCCGWAGVMSSWIVCPADSCIHSWFGSCCVLLR